MSIAQGSTPVRIQRKRTKGWRIPPGAVYVGRPSRWGNPFGVGEQYDGLGAPMTASDCVEMFALHIGPFGYFEYDSDDYDLMRRHLRGHDLVCWCPLDQPCHADVLLEIAND